MTPSEKQKEIAVAFAAYFASTTINNASNIYDSWIKREEGKRLTAEEEKKPDNAGDKIADLLSRLLTQINDNQVIMNEKFDRFEGRLKGS